MLSAIFRKTIALPTAGGHTFFTIEHILYFKADNKDALLYCAGMTDSHRIFKSLKELDTSLSTGGFLRIRRDILLNTLTIKTVCKDGSIILCNGETLHPSRERMRTVEKYLKEYFYI
jgi:DNA-binding LytR/AlgR family response regulator